MMDEEEDSSTRPLVYTSSGHSLTTGAPPIKRAVDAVHPLWETSSNYIVKILAPHEHPTSFAASPFCVPNYNHNSDTSLRNDLENDVNMDADHNFARPATSSIPKSTNSSQKVVFSPASDCPSDEEWYSGELWRWM